MEKEMTVLDVGGKPQRDILGKNPHGQAGTDYPIHMVPPVGFELGSQRWKARKEPLRQPDHPHISPVIISAVFSDCTYFYLSKTSTCAYNVLRDRILPCKISSTTNSVLEYPFIYYEIMYNWN